MARKRKSTVVKKRRVQSKKTPQTTQKKLFRWGESYTSFLLGIVVVAIGALFIGSLIKVRNIQQTSSISTVPLPSQTELKNTTEKLKEPGGKYLVSEGESLWTIAEKVYNSGYNWVDIARANNLANPDTIHEGNVLILPTISPTPNLAQALTPVPPGQIPPAIRTNVYTVQKGDYLWDIALRAYGDGFRWVDIARANNLQNPDLIFSGNTLKIPR